MCYLLRILAPPIQRELSFLTGTFLNNYDIIERKLQTLLIHLTVEKRAKGMPNNIVETSATYNIFSQEMWSMTGIRSQLFNTISHKCMREESFGCHKFIKNMIVKHSKIWSLFLILKNLSGWELEKEEDICQQLCNNKI